MKEIMRRRSADEGGVETKTAGKGKALEEVLEEDGLEGKLVVNMS